MKKNILFFLLFAPLFVFAQVQEATLLGQWSDDDNIVVVPWLSSRYNEVWGVAVNDSEVAVIGSTMGTHFIDVTDPNNPTQIQLVPGAANGTGIVHRDYHDYGGYLYAVCDEGPSTLQIIDLSGLPNSVEVVYDSNEFVIQSHNIFIDEDNARLYVVGGAMIDILSLENPAQPTLLASFPNSNLSIPSNHDIFVRDNIAYVNAGNSGFYVYDFTDVSNPIELGSMTTYPQEGYNHAGWLDEEGKYYYMMDETHDKDTKVVDVCDFGDMEVVTTFNADATSGTSIPHNCIVHCNRLYTSYYYEGLQVFDITDPANPVRIYEYDTYDGPDDDFFAGAWGVYPLLPSGNILVSDLQTGLYVFQAIEDDCTYNVLADCDTTNDAGTSAIDELVPFSDFRVFPQPNTGEINLSFSAIANDEAVFMLQNLTGKTVQSFGKKAITTGENNFSLNISAGISSGVYFLNVRGENGNKVSKIVVQK